MYAKLDSEVLASVISTVILYLMTIILKIQSANSSKLRIDVLFHLLNALDWSPVVPYTLPLMLFCQSMARCARLVLLDFTHRST